MARKTKHEVEIDIKVDSKAAAKGLKKFGDEVKKTKEWPLKKVADNFDKLGDEVEGTDERLREASTSIKDFSESLGLSGGVMLGATAAITAGAAALVAYAAAVVGTSRAGSEFALGVAQSNKELENQARLAGVTTQEMQKWTIAGKTVGVNQEKLGDILKDVNDKMGDFTATGQGQMKDFFENIAPKVGLTAESFKGLSSAEVFGKYVKGLEDANVSQAEMTFYMENIADNSTALIPLLKDNAKGMRAIGDEAERAGKILSEEFLQDTRDLSIAFGELETSYEAVLQDFANPLVEETTEFFKEMDGVLASESFKNSAKIMGELAASVLSFANSTVLSYMTGISDFMTTMGSDSASLVATYNIYQKQLDKVIASWEAAGKPIDKQVGQIDDLKDKQSDILGELQDSTKQHGLITFEANGTLSIIKKQLAVEKEIKKVTSDTKGGKAKWELLKEEAEQAKNLAKIEKEKAALAREANAQARDAERARLQAYAEEEATLIRLGEANAAVQGIKESGRQTEALAFAENNEQRMELQLEFDMLELEAEQEKLDTKLAMNGASFDQLAQSELAFQKQKSNLQIKFAADTAKREQAEARATLRVTAGALGAMSDLFSLGAKENKAFAIASKATAIGEAGVASYLAATKALAIYGPTPVGYAAAGTAVATGAFNIAKITQQEFEDGGVVGGFGGSTQGPDNTTAKVRTGEMVLNSGQQRQLFDLANGSGGTSGMTLNYSPVVSGDMAQRR